MKSMVDAGDVDLIVLSCRSLMSMARQRVCLAFGTLESGGRWSTGVQMESRWLAARGSGFRRFRLHDITRKS